MIIRHLTALAHVYVIMLISYYLIEYVVYGMFSKSIEDALRFPCTYALYPSIYIYAMSSNYLMNIETTIFRYLLYQL